VVLIPARNALGIGDEASSFGHAMVDVAVLAVDILSQ